MDIATAAGMMQTGMHSSAAQFSLGHMIGIRCLHVYGVLVIFQGLDPCSFQVGDLICRWRP